MREGNMKFYLSQNITLHEGLIRSIWKILKGFSFLENNLK